METYSHSKLSTFEQCRLKYSYQYIKRIKPDIPTTIEAYLGTCVHAALAYLYDEIRQSRTPDIDTLIAYYTTTWNRDWDDAILIVKDKPAEHYQRLGEHMLQNYYILHAPFDDETLALETTDLYTLPNGARYHIRIDRLARHGDDILVIDYKTSGYLKRQSELDADRQLAIYSAWVKDRYPQAKRIRLIWHFLAHEHALESERNSEQLKDAITQAVAKIRTIERCTSYPPTVSKLCAYCVYKTICPAWTIAPLDRFL